MNLQMGDEFERIVDVMNICFGRNYKACMKGWYKLNSSKKTYAWFPKIADLSNGKPEPGDKWYNWCNIISSDGKEIYMNNFEDPSLLTRDMPDGIEPHVTFVKRPKSRVYQYAGVFTRTHRDKEFGWVYERIATDIDTRDYI